MYVRARPACFLTGASLTSLTDCRATTATQGAQPTSESAMHEPAPHQPPSYRASLRALALHSRINLLLVFIPLSFALHYTVDLHHQEVALFVFSALGIIPLAGLLGFATEQISVKTSDAIGGLVNASMGNVVELIVAAIGLRDVGVTPPSLSPTF